MFYLIKIFFGLFLLFLYLFFKVEFEVHPHLPDQSVLTLIDHPKGVPSQVVLIIVDSLRFDYIPRFEFVKEYMEKYPNSTFLAKSTVGNPTMTTQRI
jgi:predicted AlkP superfamily pyrophosphatase or phosphodiesterase